MGQAWCKERTTKAQDSKSPLDRVFMRCAHRVRSHSRLSHPRARARMINSRVPLRGRPREVYPSPLPSPFPVHLFALLEKTRIDGLPLPCRFVVSRFLVSSSKILSVRISRGISRRHRRVRDYQRPGRNLASGSRFRRLRLIVPCLPYNFARSLPRPVVVSATTGRRVTRMKRAHTGAYSALSRLALETDTAPNDATGGGEGGRASTLLRNVCTHARPGASVRAYVRVSQANSKSRMCDFSICS